MSEHTPGPWRATPTWKRRDKNGPAQSDSFVVIGGGYGQIITSVPADNLGHSQGNAELMAAAPDLLAALRKVEWVESTPFFLCECCLQEQIQGHADDCLVGNAIAKAEGDSR